MGSKIRKMVFGMLMAASLGASAAHAGTGCRKVKGDFTAYRPQLCLSIVGICTEGTLEGDLQASYSFAVSALRPLGVSTLSRYWASSLITSLSNERDQLSGEDSGMLRIHQDGTADFITKIDITSGSGAFEGYSGKLIAQGEMSLITGATVGTYTGTLCPAAGK